ncbi:MAG: phospho-sugar mutase [Bacillota bacterium]
MEKYNYWLTQPNLDANLREELTAMARDEVQIKECFYQDLAFGTAGLRAKLGAGTNRMNVHVVRQATQGLAQTLLETGADACEKGVAIAYDSRHMSREFALQAALVLCANGIKAYLYDGIRTVPQASFTVRSLGCAGGIMITASHNPPEYNGYKVFDETGSQLGVEYSDRVMQAIESVDAFTGVRLMDEKSARAGGLLHTLGPEMDERFYDTVKSLCVCPENLAAASAFNVVYTPLHGAGYIPVTRVLGDMGIKSLHVVEKQAAPDGDFPTVKLPNPEDPQAFALAEELGRKVGADLLIATDPDGDRLGVSARTKDGGYVLLTGNQIGCIILEYKLCMLRQTGRLPKDGRVVRSVVSTTMADRICEAYGVVCEEVLTGFRFIGEKINAYEAGGGTFLFGFEESYGYLVGTHIRDKDAVSAAMLIVEAAAYYSREKGFSLLSALQDMYARYGCYLEKVGSNAAPGADGMERIAQVMQALRTSPPHSLGGFGLIAVRDYMEGMRTDVKTGTQTPLKQGESNMLYFELEKDMCACIRPSGTEPKLKYYIYARGKDPDQACLRCETLYKGVKAAIESLLHIK